jgi:AP2 domain
LPPGDGDAKLAHPKRALWTYRLTPAEAATPLALLSECFEPAPEMASGLRWRMRLPKHFNVSSGRSAEHCCNNWNSRWVGKGAGARNSHSYYVVELTIGRRKLQLLAHRIVFALARGHWPPNELDHELGLDGGNRIDNLRPATHGQNAQNQKTHRDNTSGFPGVSWDKGKGKWGAQIRASGRTIRLGRFDTREDAYVAYCAAKQIVHPFQPVTRGPPAPPLRAVDRTIASLRVVLGARGPDKHYSDVILRLVPEG